MHFQFTHILELYGRTLCDRVNLVPNLIELLERKQQRGDCNAIIDALKQEPLEKNLGKY